MGPGLLRRLYGRALMATARSAPDLPARHARIIQRVAPFTKTSRDRLAALISATEHVVRAGIPGAIAECGVWAGGSMMAVAETLLALGERRLLYLYDTFEGMPVPTERDRSITGESAAEIFRSLTRSGKKWDHASLDRVMRNLAATGWPEELTRYVPGRVEATIPGTIPETMALLRLDTDWYESTLHELVHLYPRLSAGGILIVDDYGHWQGARDAVDEYFAANPVYLHRIDYTGRLVVKR